MKITLYADLLRWKQKPDRKPLILQGARQVGKTFLLKEFGQQEYSQVFYVNFEESSQLHSIFEGEIDPDRILKYLSAHLKQTLTP